MQVSSRVPVGTFKVSLKRQSPEILGNQKGSQTLSVMPNPRKYFLNSHTSSYSQSYTLDCSGWSKMRIPHTTEKFKGKFDFRYNWIQWLKKIHPNLAPLTLYLCTDTNLIKALPQWPQDGSMESQGYIFAHSCPVAKSENSCPSIPT